MRIGLVIYGRLDTVTGGYLYDRFLVEALQRRGHVVDVAPLEAKPYPLALAANASPRIRRLAEGRSWDLLLQDGLCHPALLGLNRRIRARKGPPAVVAVLHQVSSRQPRPRLLAAALGLVEAAYFRTTDGLLATSRFTADAARRLAPAGCPIAVAPPGGDRLGGIAAEEAIAARSRRPGPLELLFVGNLSPVKGLLPLLDALARLPASLWRLTVAGSLAADRRHARRLRERASRRGLESRVAWLGPVDGERLRSVLMESQVFAMPFAHEGFGIAALEAMAFGLPVLGSSAGGVREFVRHGENGYLVPPGDAAGLVRHLAALCHDRSLLERLGRAARRTAAAHPPWGRSMERACGFLEERAAHRGRP